MHEFARDASRRLDLLSHCLREAGFRLGDYRYFTIQDPKERRICAASFEERIVHHAVMQGLESGFESFQIHDSYACRKDKGTHAAVLRTFHFARARPFFLKLDVRRYYDTVDHAALKRLLRRRFKGEEVLALLERIIDSYCTAPGKGLPIGNLTSQHFSNFYLSYFDHYVKDTPGFLRYVRYMDDMVLLGSSLSGLRVLEEKARDFLRNFLAFELKHAFMGRVDDGIPFLGFRVRPQGIYLLRKSKERFRRKLHALVADWHRGRSSDLELGLRARSLAAATLLARAVGFRRMIVKTIIL